MKTKWSSMIVLMGLAASALPMPAAGAEHPAGLMRLLASPDEIPSAATLKTLGAGDDGRALAAIAEDETLARYPRMRAASLLGHFSGPSVERALLALAEGATARDIEVRIQAIASLGFVLRERARPTLARLASAPELEIRRAAERAVLRLSTHIESPTVDVAPRTGSQYKPADGRRR